MLLEYANAEITNGERVVVTGAHFVVVVPYWAMWPYETLLMPYRRHIARLDQLTDDEVRDLATTMRRLLIKYDNLFQCEVRAHVHTARPLCG